MTNEDRFYYLFRGLKQKAAEVYSPTRLAEAKTFEDVARIVLYSFDGSNLELVAKKLGYINPEQFKGLLEFAIAIARIQEQTREGNWE